jgi:hypothetical protein
MTADQHHDAAAGQPFDVDAIVHELAACVEAEGSGGAGLTPFAAQFRGADGVEMFEVEPEVHGSTKPVIGTAVTRGKEMVARAAAPMVASLGEQVAMSLAEMRRTIDDLLEEQARLRETVAALERRLDEAEDDGPPRSA